MSAARDHAPDRAHPAEDDHAEQEDRELEVEVRRERARAVAREERARDAAEERADRVRPGLRPHQRDAHRRGGRLVLADRDPRAPEPRVAQPDAAEDGEEDERRSPSSSRGRPCSTPRGRRTPPNAERVDRRDPERSVRQVEAADRVGVPDELRDDLAEPERHDREVVAAQAQRRQADDDPDDRREEPRRRSGRATWRGGCPGGRRRPAEPRWNVTWSKCSDANQPATYAPAA